MERHVMTTTTAQEMTNVYLEFVLEMRLSVLLKNNANSLVFVPILLGFAPPLISVMVPFATIQIYVQHLINVL